MSNTDLTRRTFLKATGAAGAAAAVGAGVCATAPMKSNTVKRAFAAEGEDERIVWSHCHVNCGGACVLRFHMVGDTIKYVESDNTGSAEFGDIQMRACLRGRSIRRWLDHPDRLNYPLKRREGTKRGEGVYDQITWDEALDTIASEFTRIKETYGNEAIFIQECSGVEQNIMMNNPFFRLFNLLGGEVTRYGNYSNAAINFGSNPFTYGDSWGRRSFKSLQKDQLVVLFGDSVMDMRMGGDGAGYDLNVAMEKQNVRVIMIDPRRNEVATNKGAEWIPIRPGTDAALVAGIAHELEALGLTDHDFLKKYCVGYSEDTLPEGAPKNSSYYAYIMGEGYDKVEKTPAWAAAITGIPEARIKQLAREIGEAKPLFVDQGWGMQRHANGDFATRAVMLLPQLVGQVGKPGTNAGTHEGNTGFPLPSLPTGDNPIEAQFPNYLWPEAIKDGTALTAKNAGIKGADKLPASIKFLVNYGNNMPAGQNGDINFTADILRDDSLCEFILCYDVMMTPSAKFADIILPDLTPQETYSLSAAGEMNDSLGIWFGQPIREPLYERREVYEVCGELAKRLGVYDEYSEGGMTREDWCRKLYDELREEVDGLPTYDEGVAMGMYKRDVEIDSSTELFIQDPEKNPLETATGKIQVYSPELAKLADEWELPEGDAIVPIPAYVPGFEGAGSQTEQRPLQLFSFHYRAHTHSTYANNEVVQKSAAHQLWINPADAEPRGIADGDTVSVTTDRGEVHILAKVTNRIVPGAVALPEGGWYDPDSNGIDKGGCINTLVSRHTNPISKGTGQQSSICEVKKVGA